MYLYDKKKNKIDIYNLTSNDKKIYEYRIKQMKKIPRNEILLRCFTNEKNDIHEVFKIYENQLDTKIIPIEKVDGFYHKLEPDSLASRSLIDSYYKGELKDKKIAKVQDLKKIRYLLLTKTEYTYYNSKKVLDGIIEIPESLYLLSLIENEKFSLIDGNINEQLSLFEFKKTKQVDLETIQALDNLGIIPNCYSDIIKKTENDNHILKLIKK